MSFLTDMYIILKTVKIVLTGREREDTRRPLRGFALGKTAHKKEGKR